MSQKDITLLDIEAVAARLGMGKTTIHAKIKAGAFPQPVRLSANCVRWRSDEVAAWIDQATQKARTDDSAIVATVKARAQKANAARRAKLQAVPA
jgi:prophage regulatory protein